METVNIIIFVSELNNAQSIFKWVLLTTILIGDILPWVARAASFYLFRVINFVNAAISETQIIISQGSATTLLSVVRFSSLVTTLP